MNRDQLMKKHGLVGTPKRGLSMATFGFFIGFAAVSLYGPVANNLNHYMKLSGLMLGFLVAATNLTGSLLRIPFGAWVDKAGGKKPFLTLLSLSVLGMAGLTIILHFYYPEHLTKSMYPIIILFGLLSGCGIATFSVGIPQTSYWYPAKRQGFALGAYGGLGNTAPGIFGMLLPFALSSLGLINAYFAWFLFLLVGTIIYAIYAKDAYYFQLLKKGESNQKALEISKQLGQELHPSGNLIQALKISAKIGNTWALVALYFTSFGGFLALTAWFPTYWTQVFGIGGRLAGILMALGFSLLASFIRIYGGSLSDKIGGEITAVMSYSAILVGALLLVFTHTFIIALIGEIIMGAGMGVANAAVFSLVPKYVAKAPGGGSGWVGGLGAFGGFVVPPILGSFVDSYGTVGYSNGFIVYIVLAVLSIIISLVLRSKQKQTVTGGEISTAS